MSILQGRHPEHERLRREDERRKAKRTAETDARAKDYDRRRRARGLAVAAAAVAVTALGVVAATYARTELAHRARAESASAPFLAHGFTVLAASARGAPAHLEASAPAGCFLAASTSTAPLRLSYADSVTEGPGPVLACTCAPGTVTAASEGASPDDALVLMRADVAAIGGSRAFPFLPFRPGTLGETDSACEDASLDAWIEAKTWSQVEPAGELRPSPTPAPDAVERWFDFGDRAALRSAGFELASILDRDAPFVVLEVPEETCVLVLHEGLPARANIRRKGGARAVGAASGNIAWCTRAAETVSVHGERRDDPFGFTERGDFGVFLAPSSRVGGLFGLAEIAAEAGARLLAAAVAPGDHGWSAAQLLEASAVPATLISAADAPDLKGPREARIAAVSAEQPDGIVADAPPEVFSFCSPLEPPLLRPTLSLCAFSGPQTFRVDGPSVVGGVARAALPFWLFALEEVQEPAAMKVEVQLLTLARKLRREGFEPTTIEAVTELDQGAEILGRTGEDAFVAIGLAPHPPWALPYSDGPAWTIDGEPRVVPIRPLERVTVRATTRALPPKATRRTVVFRRHVGGSP